MSTGTLAPYVFPQLEDNDGALLAGGFIWTYLAGTSTPTTTWTDAALSVPNTNPIVLDASGRYVAYLDALSYKFVLQDANGVTIKTQDGIGSVGLTQSGVYDIFNFFGDSTSPITDTSYPSGTTVDKTHAGTTLYIIDSGNIAPGTYNLSGMLLCTGIDTVTVALVNLTDGTPDIPLVSISSVVGTGSSVTSSPITFAVPGSVKTYAIKAKVTGGSGFAWGLQLIKSA